MEDLMNRRRFTALMATAFGLGETSRLVIAATDPEKIDEVFASSAQYGKRFFTVTPVVEFDEIQFSVHCEAYAASFREVIDSGLLFSSLISDTSDQRYGSEQLMIYLDLRAYDSDGVQGFEWVDPAPYGRQPPNLLYRPADHRIADSMALLFQRKNTVQLWYFRFAPTLAEISAVRYMIDAAEAAAQRIKDADRWPDQDTFMTLLPHAKDFIGDVFELEGERYVSN
jgi:hypothetical protein